MLLQQFNLLSCNGFAFPTVEWPVAMATEMQQWDCQEHEFFAPHDNAARVHTTGCPLDCLFMDLQIFALLSPLPFPFDCLHIAASHVS